MNNILSHISIEMMMDIAIIALLVPTIIYTWMLNKRLRAMRQSKQEMEKLIEAFNQSTIRAETGIPRLRAAAEGSGQKLQAQVEKARSLRDDLAFMVERAETMANQLENNISAVRREITNPSPAMYQNNNIQSAPLQNQQDTNQENNNKFIKSETQIENETADFEFDFENDRSKAERELLQAIKSIRSQITG
jgi:type II secretory pathway pseudopilin PulG